jgi:hypothetical protein
MPDPTEPTIDERARATLAAEHADEPAEPLDAARWHLDQVRAIAADLEARPPGSAGYHHTPDGVIDLAERYAGALGAAHVRHATTQALVALAGDVRRIADHLTRADQDRPA